MKTISSTLLDAQKQHNMKYTRKVTLKRRNTAGTSWESPGLDITNYIVKIGKINWKLDTEALNTWKTSNVTIEVKNTNNEWKEDNDLGLFYGYLAYLSKVEIEAGQVLSDGTTETLFIFRGLITNILTDSVDGKANIHLEGLERLLIDADAEKVSTAVNGENIGTGNGTNAVFYTVQFGVGKIKKVYVAGVEKQVGKHYDVSQLNDKTQGAKITFKTTPVDYRPQSGQVVTCDYIYWYPNATIDYLVKKLLEDGAGITPANYVVDNAVFDIDILNLWLQDTQTDFDAGTKTNVDTATTPGEIIISKTNESAEIQQQNSNNEIFMFNVFNKKSQSFRLVYGDRFLTKAQVLLRKLGSPTGTMYIRIRDSLNGNILGETTKDVSTLTTINTWYDFTFSDIVLSNGGTYYLELNYNGGDTSNHILIRIATNNPYIYGYLYQNDFLDSSYDMTFNIYTRYYYSSADFISQKKDLTASLKSLGKLNYTIVLNGQTITFYTQTSDDGISWTEPWVALSIGNYILSAIKRYIRVKAVFTTSGVVTPRLLDFTVNWATTATVISLANFTGKTVQQAIEELAKMVDYEIGFNAEDGKYFFRSKDPSSTIDYEFKDSDNLIKITNHTDGWDRVYNLIVATFGNYSKEMSPETEGESSPNSFDKYKKRKLTISGGQLTANDNVDLATGIAQRYYNRYKNPKEMFKLTAKFIMQIDLGDTVKIIQKYLAFKQSNYSFFGDGGLWADGGLWTSTESFFMYEKTGKVIGISLDTEVWQIETDIKEA